MTTPPIQLTIIPGEVLVAALAGELDMSNAASVETRIVAEIHHQRAVLIDLSELTFMDSTGLAMLNRLAAQTVTRGQPLRIVAGKESVPRRVLEIVNLGLPIDDTRGDAHAALALDSG